MRYDANKNVLWMGGWMDDSIPIIPSLLQSWGLMKEEFALRAVRQRLSIFDLDLRLQRHISDLKPLL